MGSMGDVKIILAATKDITLKLNSTLYTAPDGVTHAFGLFKSSATLSACGIGIYNAAEDYICQDKVCFVLSCVGSAADATTFVCGKIPVVRYVTLGSVPILVGCKAVRGYCKRWGSLPGCK
jgi:hypothetical protein